MGRGILIVVLLLGSLRGFAEKPVSSYWKPVDPVFDSIAAVLELEFIEGDDALSRDSLIQELYRKAGDNPGKKVYCWRAKFWDARAQLKKNNSDSTLRLIDEAYHEVDSVRYTYDFMRIFHLWSVMNKEQPHVTYGNLKRIAGYYAHTGNLFMLAHAYIDMGNILSRVKDYPKALEYFQKADAYYRELGEAIYRAKNQLNISNVLFLMGETSRSDQILHGLLRNPVCVGDTAFHISTLLSLTEHDIARSEKYVTEAYRLSAAFANRGLSIQSEYFLGRYYQDARNPARALSYYRMAVRQMDKRNIDLVVPAMKSMSDCFASLHQTDSAYFYLNRYEHYKDSLDQINSLAEIRHLESRAAIEKQEMELQQAEERNRFRLVLVGVGGALILCLAVFICYVFWKRSRDEQVKKQMKELENKELTMRLEHETLQKDYFKMEVESKDRELASNSLIIMEKNRALKSLVEELEREKAMGNITPGAASQIGHNVKIHLGSGNEWDFFKMQFVKVHPEFFVRLKALCPTITEGELRLCAYIRTGMEIKHIAQMLSLQPESVKKNRYRLRQKLQLGKEDSLEDFLRGI